jgi:trehalose/maltose hydrolase-like predicted phosphorylase
MFPWESDPDRGTEEIPLFVHQLSERQIHVNGDIAIAQWQYFLASGDREWLRNTGFPVIREVAAFWKSRSTYNARRDIYEIHHVTSPDEIYDDVSNDSFTNAVAQKALRNAAAAAETLGVPPDPSWREIAEKMYIPFSEIEQRHLDFDISTSHDKHTWMGSTISWLSYPPLDLKMSVDVRRNDFKFATQALHDLTPDANDMIPVLLPTVAAELGDENEADRRLRLSMGGFLKPPFNVRSETSLNNATYILCVSSGFLENFLYGFTGLRITDDGLTQVYPPLLPSGLKSLTLTNVAWRGQHTEITVSRDQTGQAKLSRKVLTP